MSCFLRRAFLVLVLLAASLGLAARTAQAELEQGLLSASGAMLDLPPSYFRAAPRRIELNGARMQISSGRSELALSALLDHVQAACHAHDGGFARLVAEAQRASKHPLPALDGSVLRAENQREGVVACLDLGTQDLTLAQVARRLERFSGRLDLAELGGVRMVRAQALEHGTFFVVAESQGPVPLASMFPSAGDAPGLDFALLPRPAHSRRILSAWQAAGEPALAAYLSPKSVDDTWAAYVADLATRGWTPGSAAQAQSRREHAELFFRGGHSALVVVTRDGSGSEVVVMPMDAGPGAVLVR